MSGEMNSSVYCLFSKEISLLFCYSAPFSLPQLFLKEMSSMLALHINQTQFHCNLNGWGRCVLGHLGDSLKICIVCEVGCDTGILADLELAVTLELCIFQRLKGSRPDFLHSTHNSNQNGTNNKALKAAESSLSESGQLKSKEEPCSLNSERATVWQHIWVCADHRV